MYFLKTQFFQKAQLQKAKPNSPKAFIPLSRFTTFERCKLCDIILGSPLPNKCVCEFSLLLKKKKKVTTDEQTKDSR